MKSKINLLLALVLLCSYQLIAQNPVPNPPQSQKMAIVGATLHLGNGEVIENGQVLFSDGKIESVSNTSTDTPSGYEIVDGSGKHVYPGLIALLSGLGLTEIGAVRATRDGRETGLLNPNVRALIAFNTDSQIIPTVRSRGIMLAQIVPSGGRISGKSSVVEMDGWNWEDAVRRADEGVHINWPRLTTFNWRERTYKANEKYEEQVTALKNFLKQAAAYCTDGRVGETQLKLAAMCEAMKGEATLYIHTGYARSIQEAVLAMKELGVKPVIAGGYESFMITDFLKQEDISVILYSTQSLPEEEDDDVDQPFKTPAQLAEAGVDFALSHGNNWDQRNIPFTVGTAVAYGLPYERAIQSITLNAAKILGIDETYGSLEAGKSATLIVVDGDVLDMRTSEVEMAFIDGRKVDLDNKQAELERKFREKYRRGE